jgi:NAD(P)-dependent dehydrogenase (short-subunit alcohol dehydrogenase family)
MVADLDQAAAERVAQEIASIDSSAAAVQVDVRKQDAVQRMVDATVQTFGGIDILVNNAGVGKIIPFFETTEADWDLMFDVNGKGVLFCSQAVA